MKKLLLMFLYIAIAPVYFSYSMDDTGIQEPDVDISDSSSESFSSSSESDDDQFCRFCDETFRGDHACGICGEILPSVRLYGTQPRMYASTRTGSGTMGYFEHSHLWRCSACYEAWRLNEPGDGSNCLGKCMLL